MKDLGRTYAERRNSWFHVGLTITIEDEEMFAISGRFFEDGCSPTVSVKDPLTSPEGRLGTWSKFRIGPVDWRMMLAVRNES